MSNKTHNSHIYTVKIKYANSITIRDFGYCYYVADSIFLDNFQAFYFVYVHSYGKNQQIISFTFMNMFCCMIKKNKILSLVHHRFLCKNNLSKIMFIISYQLSKINHEEMHTD